MTLRRVQANTVVFAAGVAVLGLAACMHNDRQAAIRLQPAPYAYGLFYTDEGSSAKLTYGAPNSDDVSLMMQCAKGSHMVDVSDVARDGVSTTLILASGGKSTRLNAVSGSGDGESLMVARAPTDALPLQSFRRSGRVDVVYSGARYVIVASPSERAGVERFFHDCDRSTATMVSAQVR